MEEMRGETKPGQSAAGWGEGMGGGIMITKGCVTPTIELRSPWRRAAMLY